MTETKAYDERVFEKACSRLGSPDKRAIRRVSADRAKRVALYFARENFQLSPLGFTCEIILNFTFKEIKRLRINFIFSISSSRELSLPLLQVFSQVFNTEARYILGLKLMLS